jgi:CHAT domain-containing protein
MLSQGELRHLLDEVASPESRDETPAAGASPAVTTVLGVAGAPPSEPGYRHPFDHVVVGRRRQHRVDLRFALGSITEVDARALALGIFRGVTPTGAASALDRRLGGAITELSRRRMFSGQVGEIFMMPTGRHLITTDLITFVGLGDFDRFNDEVLQTAAENVIRTFINTRVEEFATVMFGGASGESPASALRNLLLGFFRGLRDADRDHQFRRLIVCEKDPDRYVQLKEELLRLSSTALCEDVELTFDEVRLREPPETPDVPRRLQPRETPIYLIVRQERAGTRGRPAEIRSSLLTAGAKATVVTGAREVDVTKFEALRRRATSDSTKDFRAVGNDLSELLLADEVRTVLPRFRQNHLVIVHDGAMSRVPWEVLAMPVNGSTRETWFPAAEKGISHRYAADHLSIAKWLEERIDDNILNVLLVVNPTEDLAGAEEEGGRIRERLQNRPGVRLEELRNGAATRPALLDAFSSGRFDVIHYAGHAEFDERNPERSGIVCHDDIRLTGADLAGLGNLPALVFFNACEAARVRSAGPKQTSTSDRRANVRLKHLTNGVGLAEAFMRGGVANFLGTYWPVGDFAAKTFADSFYSMILEGRTVGQAIQQGRTAIQRQSRDWANYIFYGNPDFVLKDVSTNGGGG